MASVRCVRRCAFTAAVFLALASVAAASDSCCAPSRTIEAVGVSFADVPENRTVVRLSIFVEGPSPFEAINNIESVTRQARDFLSSQENVFKIRATVSYISPDYDYNFNQETGESSRTLKGYRTGGSITFEIPQLSSAALDGVTAIDGIEFQNIQRKESFEALREGQKEALKNSVYEAKVVAERMLETQEHLSVGEVLSVKGRADQYLSFAGGESKVVKAEATVTYEIVTK